MAVTTVCCV